MAITKSNGAYVRRYTIFQNLDVSVAVAGLTELAEVVVNNAENLGFRLAVELGANALDQFVVSYKFYPGGTYEIVTNAGADFTTPLWPVLGKTVDLTTLADDASSHALMDVRGVHQVKIEASGGTTVQVVNIEGCLF